jgi:hypothetical protein
MNRVAPPVWTHGIVRPRGATLLQMVGFNQRSHARGDGGPAELELVRHRSHKIGRMPFDRTQERIVDLARTARSGHRRLESFEPQLDT